MQPLNLREIGSLARTPVIAEDDLPRYGAGRAPKPPVTALPDYLERH
jgi:hypothetical protein